LLQTFLRTKKKKKNQRVLADPVNSRLRLHTIHTPGHTPGSMSFLIEGSPVLFSGDTLFPGGPGATSFPGGDFPTIIESIGRKLLTLPADTLVLPGHGDDTTIGTERPHLQEWIDRGW